MLDLLHHLYVRVYPLAELGQSAMAVFIPIVIATDEK